MLREIDIDELRKFYKYLKPHASEQHINIILADYLSKIKY